MSISWRFIKVLQEMIEFSLQGWIYLMISPFADSNPWMLRSLLQDFSGFACQVSKHMTSYLLFVLHQFQGYKHGMYSFWILFCKCLLLALSVLYPNACAYGSVEPYQVFIVSVVQSGLAHNKLFFKFWLLYIWKRLYSKGG